MIINLIKTVLVVLFIITAACIFVPVTVYELALMLLSRKEKEC